jgi:hypothetical protein
VEDDAAVGAQLTEGELIVGIASFPPPMPATVYELLGGKHADEIAEKTCRTLTLFASYLQVSFSVGRDLSSQPGFVTRSRRAISARSGHRTFEGCLPLLSLRSNFGAGGKTAVTIFDTGGRYAAGDQAADLAVQHSGDISWGRDAQRAANIPACASRFSASQRALRVVQGFFTRLWRGHVQLSTWPDVG